MAEIDDTRAAQYLKLTELIGEIQSNPEARGLMDKAIKKIRPNVETEEDVAERYAAPVKKQLEEVRAEFTAFVKAQEDERKAWQDDQEKRAMHNAFADLRKTKGYTDDGINEIADMMVKRGIADPYAAAARYDELHPPAPEIPTSSYEPQRWNLAPEDDVKRLFTDADGWEADAIGSALRDVRSQVAH